MQMSSGGKPIDDLLFFGVPVLLLLLLLLVLWLVVFVDASPLPLPLATEFDALFVFGVASLAAALFGIGSVEIV